MNSRIDADLEQIRLGLRLVAEELPAPSAAPQSRRRRPRRFIAVAVALVATVVPVALAVVSSGGSGPAAASRFLPDAFDYQAPPALSAGGMFGGSPPALSYFVPYLSGVAAVSAHSAWAVGSTTEGNSVVWRWDGTTWRDVPIPAASGRLNLTSVAAVGDDDVWAVGWQTKPIDRLNYDTHAVIEHWDGARWQLVPVPYAGQSSLFSVAAGGPRDVWAVGESYHDTQATLKDEGHGKFPVHHDRLILLHWDGTSWSTVRLPWARTGLSEDATVVTTGPTDVWVVTSGTVESGGASGKQVIASIPQQVEHWNGEKWEAVPLPFGPNDGIAGFTATSATDAWAVGSYRQAGHSRTLAARWNGQTWQIAPTPNRRSDSTLTDVVAVRPDDVWAIGESQWLRAAGKTTTLKWPVALFEHWDGRSWTVMPGVTPPMWAGQSITATEDGTALVAGSCYYDNVITRWDGRAWQISPHPPDQHPANPKWLTCTSPEAGG